MASVLDELKTCVSMLRLWCRMKASPQNIRYRRTLEVRARVRKQLRRVTTHPEYCPDFMISREKNGRQRSGVFRYTENFLQDIAAPRPHAGADNFAYRNRQILSPSRCRSATPLAIAIEGRVVIEWLRYTLAPRISFTSCSPFPFTLEQITNDGAQDDQVCEGCGVPDCVGRFAVDDHGVEHRARRLSL